MGQLNISDLSTLQGSPKSKSLRLLRRLQWFRFDKKWINKIRARDSQFYSCSNQIKKSCQIRLSISFGNFSQNFSFLRLTALYF